MPKNPLNTVTLGQTTEGCQQMRRRFRSGVAADLTVWLIMLRRQYEAQMAAVPRPVDTITFKYASGTKQYLATQIASLNALAERVVDRFSAHEWNTAAEQFANAIDMTTSAVDPACAAVAQALDDPEREGESLE